ncbi:MAG: hypothetical protein HY814_14290 [Candidatus Riflebacteria bacterium]|nr:hypothetical protein [Candidatus Riflebacteria bacterium]
MPELVVVPTTRPIRQWEFRALLVAALLWSVQGIADLAVQYGITVPPWVGFVGASAGLLFTGLSLVLRLAAPETLSGFSTLDRSTREAAIPRRGW